MDFIGCGYGNDGITSPPKTIEQRHKSTLNRQSNQWLRPFLNVSTATTTNRTRKKKLYTQEYGAIKGH